MPALLVVICIEKRTSIIEGSTGLEGQHGQVVGTAGLVLALQLEITEVAIVLDDEVLDGGTFGDDELENLVARNAGLSVSLVGIEVSSNQGNASEGAHQQEIVVGTQEAGFVLQVLILVNLSLVVEVENVVLERLVLP